MTESNSSNSSRGEGIQISPPDHDKKVKQHSAAKRWTMRWSNYPSEWKEKVVPEFQDHGCRGYVIGEEICPSTGTPHLQGYGEFNDKIRWSEFKSLPKGIEWQAAKGTKAQNMIYCSKEGKFISSGTCKIKPIYKVEIELYEWQKNIVKIIDEPPDDRDIYWFWEEKGCAGKTTFQKWIFLNYKSVAILSGKASDMKNGIVAYEEKNEQLPEIILINIPRCQDADHVSWQGIEEIKDMFFYSPKYEGGMVCGANPHVLIFSNKQPPMDKLSSDRWKIIHI